MPFVTHSFLATLTDSESCPPRRTPAVRQPFVASARCTAASVPNCGPRPWAHRRGTNERASRPSTTRGPTIRTRRKGGSTPLRLPTGRRESRGPAAPGRRDSGALGAPTFLVSEPIAGPDVRKQRDKGAESKGQTSPASGPREDRRSGHAYPSITTSEAGIEPSGHGEASERAQPSPGRAPAVLHRVRERGSPLG